MRAFTWVYIKLKTEVPTFLKPGEYDYDDDGIQIEKATQLYIMAKHQLRPVTDLLDQFTFTKVHQYMYAFVQQLCHDGIGEILTEPFDKKKYNDYKRELTMARNPVVQ